MPSNSTWVCFDCRTALRRTRLARLRPEATVCPKCGRQCIDVSKKIAIPPKSNVRAWKALRVKVREWYQANLEQFYESKVRRKHKLERQIVALKSLPTNEGRNKTISELRSQLAELR